MTPDVYWVRVEAPHFVAALKITDERCTEAAPILRWAIGQTADQLRDQFRRRNWKATIRMVAPL
jgi:hypothetical protein